MGRSKVYTDEERQRRDASPWTLVQAVLAPIQFLVFLVSLVLVLHTLITGSGAIAANASVVIKTLVLYTIMVTGSMWEKDVFGKYLFAPSFFWEDAVSFVAIALHTFYVAALISGWYSQVGLLIIALLAYLAYVVNAGQFLLKFRHARRELQSGAMRMEVQA